MEIKERKNVLKDTCPKQGFGSSIDKHTKEQEEKAIKPCMNQFKVLVNELRGITTINLAFKSANIMEKVIWLLILMIGTFWACYFITLQFEIWAEHPSIVTKADNVKLSDLNYPGMTICYKAGFPKLIQKYPKK